MLSAAPGALPLLLSVHCRSLLSSALQDLRWCCTL